MSLNCRTYLCDFKLCSERTPTFNCHRTLAAWLLNNRWEAVWYFKPTDAEPTFRVRCPKHPFCSE